MVEVSYAAEQNCFYRHTGGLILALATISCTSKTSTRTTDAYDSPVLEPWRLARRGRMPGEM